MLVPFATLFSQLLALKKQNKTLLETIQLSVITIMILRNDLMAETLQCQGQQRKRSRLLGKTLDSPIAKRTDQPHQGCPIHAL